MPSARRPGRGKPAKRGRRTGGAATTPRTESREQAPAAAVQHAVIAGDVTWTPPFRSVFLFLFGMRVWGAVVNTISDCDEVYNYWEPTHQLMYGRGFQTWEYSPQYALRSYIYVGAHAVVGKALAFIVGSESPKVSNSAAAPPVAGCQLLPLCSHPHSVHYASLPCSTHCAASWP